MTASRIALYPSPHLLRAEERAVRLANPGFGRVFTEHMVTIRYVEGKGWHDGKLVPYGPIELEPAASVLH